MARKHERLSKHIPTTAERYCIPKISLKMGGGAVFKTYAVFFTLKMCKTVLLRDNQENKIFYMNVGRFKNETFEYLWGWTCTCTTIMIPGYRSDAIPITIG